MRAARVDNKDAVRSAVHPDAVFLLPLGVHTESVVGGIANFENRGRLKKCSRKEETKERNEPRAKKRRHGAPDQPATPFIGLAGLGPDAGYATCRRGFGRADGRRADVFCRVRTAGGRRFRRLRLRFHRFRFRTRHAEPPRLYALLENSFPAVFVCWFSITTERLELLSHV